ncbi:hypothetical protein Scuro_06 [Acinetobacter phage Scuro]|nr:hypothetical protein Scuro_06 [Acinetobacter phage Scuro]
MNLRALAEADLGRILENKSTGFGWDITLTNPEGKTELLTGFSQDIALAIDPDMGVLVSGRTASVALRIGLLRAKGFTENPRNISDENKKPWVVGFKDINGTPCLFKVVKSNPDAMIGCVTLLLEAYKQAIFYDGTWTFNGDQHYDGILKWL